MQVKKQQLKLDKEHKTGSKSGKEYSRLYILPCLFNLYAGYSIKNAGLDEAQAGIKIAWRIPWMEEPGGLQSMVSQRVRQD